MNECHCRLVRHIQVAPHARRDLPPLRSLRSLQVART